MLVTNEKKNSNLDRRSPWRFIIILVSIFMSLALMFSLMPKGFNMTHEEIGAGRPALVFVYDVNLLVSIEQTEQMNLARDQLGEQVVFLIAKINTPEGDQLIYEHKARVAELLLFDASGKLIKRQSALKSADELVHWLK